MFFDWCLLIPWPTPGPSGYVSKCAIFRTSLTHWFCESLTPPEQKHNFVVRTWSLMFFHAFSFAIRIISHWMVDKNRYHSQTENPFGKAFAFLRKNPKVFEGPSPAVACHLRGKDFYVWLRRTHCGRLRGWFGIPFGRCWSATPSASWSRQIKRPSFSTSVSSGWFGVFGPFFP